MYFWHNILYSLYWLTHCVKPGLILFDPVWSCLNKPQTEVWGWAKANDIDLNQTAPKGVTGFCSTLLLQALLVQVLYIMESENIGDLQYMCN